MKVDQSIAKGLLVLNVLNVFLPYIQDLMSEILSAASTHGTLRLSRLSSVTALTRTAGGGPVAPWHGDLWSFCGSVNQWCAKQSWHQKNVKKNRDKTIVFLQKPMHLKWMPACQEISCQHFNISSWRTLERVPFCPKRSKIGRSYGLRNLFRLTFSFRILMIWSCSCTLPSTVMVPSRKTFS